VIIKLKTLEDVEKYAAENDNAIALAWQDMLYDMEHGGEDYRLSDFITEAFEQVAQGNLALKIVEEQTCLID